MRSLRAREFAAIAAAAILTAGMTLILAVLLVRSSVRQEALKSLARQAALIAAERNATRSSHASPSLGLFFDTQQERLAILSVPQAALLLPSAGATSLRSGQPAQGSVTISGRRYLYAARADKKQAIVLLRSAKLEASDLRPFTIAFAIAAAVGAAIAAFAAILLARAVSRPIERVSEASLALARGERPGPLPLSGSSEVVALAAAFNQLTSDLDQARDAERSFLLSVSHELKTPLASIRGHGEALLDQVMTVPRAAGVVVEEAKRLERLVRDLLDLARLNQQSFSVAPQPVDLAEIVKDAVARHGPESSRVGVSLEARTEPPAPAYADPDRTLQVLSNLIENALRATPAGGTVIVTAAPGALTVADTGPGLDPDDMPHAFDRFYLHRRNPANRQIGTGLGLAIVKELTEAMGGTVSVESAPDGGTSFRMTLPEQA